MDYRVRFTEEAVEELIEITEFIAKDSPAIAKQFLIDLTDKFESVLSIFPESGGQYKKLEGVMVRKISFKDYTAFYSIDFHEAVVNVLHIVNLTKPLETRV